MAFLNGYRQQKSDTAMISHFCIASSYPEFGSWYLPWLIFLEISALLCFGVLYLGWRIAGNIGQDRSFSMENASFLKKIAYCAAGDTIYFFIGNIALWLCVKGMFIHIPCQICPDMN